MSADRASVSYPALASRAQFASRPTSVPRHWKPPPRALTTPHVATTQLIAAAIHDPIATGLTSATATLSCARNATVAAA